MDSDKRASMREGPLAALFKRTEEQAAEERERGVGARALGAVEPAPPAGAPVASAPAPVPSSSPSAPSPAGARRATPQDRLRQAFSSDLPVEAPRRPAPVEISEVPEIGVPRIRVVGVGGAGVNAVNRMIEAGVEAVQFVAINTDVQSLQQSAAHVTLQVGAELTRGLGSGADPELGRSAAMEDYDRVKSLLKGSDMIFITAGEGGGTGTGAAPVVARIARELGALTVGIVTKPFGFEGSRRAAAAQLGIEALAEEVDTLIVVPNNRLLSVLDRHTSMVDAFRVADDVLRQGVQGISDLITLPGLINLDFADVRTVMSDAGPALLGIGMGTGEKRAVDAAAQAVSSPLLETSVDGARAILLSITAGDDLSLWEVNEAAQAVADAAHPDANIIFGALVDPRVNDQVWVTVVATGFEAPPPLRRAFEGEGRFARRDAGGGSGTAGGGFVEPRGEPRVRRGEDAAGGGRRGERPARNPMEVDVPEFMPRR